MKKNLLVLLIFTLALASCKKEEDEKKGTISAAIKINLPTSGSSQQFYMKEKAKVELLKGGAVISTMYAQDQENLNFGQQSYGDYVIKVKGVMVMFEVNTTRSSYHDVNGEASFKLSSSNQNISVEAAP
jgi:hypothetical protein